MSINITSKQGNIYTLRLYCSNLSDFRDYDAVSAFVIFIDCNSVTSFFIPKMASCT